MRTGEKDSTRVAAGLKAAIHNPNVSDEAKERAAERLEGLGGEREHHESRSSGQDSNRVLGGYKATLTVRDTEGFPYVRASLTTDPE